MNRSRQKSSRKQTQLRGRNSLSPKKRRRKARSKGPMHFLRGMVLEGFGVVVLAFLYFTITTTSSNQLVKKQPQADSTVSIVKNQQGTQNGFASSSEATAQSIRQPQMTGHVASSWTEYTRNSRQRFGHQNTLSTTQQGGW